MSDLQRNVFIGVLMFLIAAFGAFIGVWVISKKRKKEAEKNGKLLSRNLVGNAILSVNEARKLQEYPEDSKVAQNAAQELRRVVPLPSYDEMTTTERLSAALEQDKIVRAKATRQIARLDYLLQKNPVNGHYVHDHIHNWKVFTNESMPNHYHFGCSTCGTSAYIPKKEFWGKPPIDQTHWYLKEPC